MLTRSRLLPALGLVLFALLVYGRTATFHFVNWDDRHHVYANPAVVAPETASAADRLLGRNIGYPLPLTLATWRLDRALHGPERPGQVSPAMGVGYHRTQLVLILLLALAIYALGLITLPSRWLAAAFAGLVLAHPALAEPLSWVTGRKDLLALLFSALCLGALWQTRARSGAWWAAALFGLLAMASKPTAVSLAAFAGWVWWRGRPPRDVGLRERRAAAAAVAVLVLVAGLVVLVGSHWHEALGGAGTSVGESAGGGPLGRSAQATGLYLQMLLAPSWLRARYVLPVPTGVGPAELAAGVALLLGVGLALHPRTRHRHIGWGAALALCAWLPVSNLVPLRRHVADSYVALPWLALAWGGVGELATAARAQRSRLVVAAVCLLAAALTPRAMTQVETWRTSEHLWRHALKHEPDSPQVCRMAGHAQHFEGQPRRALATWEACAARFGPALFANNLGQVAAQVGDRARAERWLGWVLARRPGDPRATRALARLRAGGQARAPAAD